MITKLNVQIEQDNLKILVEKLEHFNLFKFNDELQARMEELLERKKADLLTQEEIIELE